MLTKLYICPGFHEPSLTRSFLDALICAWGNTWCDRFLLGVLPAEVPPYAPRQILAHLEECLEGIGDRGQGIGNRGQGIGNRGQGTGNRGQGTGNRGQGTGNRGQGTGNRGQGTGNRGQGTGNRGQGTGNRGQGIGDRGWGVGEMISVVWIGFSAGVVGALLAARQWHRQGHLVTAFIAVDGWGVPLWADFPVYSLSPDRFAYETTRGLRLPLPHFYAEPPVSHLALWENPDLALGWEESPGQERSRLTATEYLKRRLRGIWL